MYFFWQLKVYYSPDGPGKVRNVGRPLIRVIEGKIRSQVEVILNPHSYCFFNSNIWYSVLSKKYSIFNSCWCTKLNVCSNFFERQIHEYCLFLSSEVCKCKNRSKSNHIYCVTLFKVWKLESVWKQFMQNILQSLQGFKALSLRALKHQGHRENVYSDEEKNVSLPKKSNLTKRSIANALSG